MMARDGTVRREERNEVKVKVEDGKEKQAPRREERSQVQVHAHAVSAERRALLKPAGRSSAAVLPCDLRHVVQGLEPSLRASPDLWGK